MVKNKKDTQYYEAVGRRKEAVSRVRLHIAVGKSNVDSNKKGDILINKIPLSKYLPLESDMNRVLKPLTLTQNQDRFITTIQVKGGGKNGQVESIALGISRALCLVDESLKHVLKAEGLLTRDARVRERRMVGTGGKSRRQKQSPKR
jgi:small subunit ribosomal protein S9